MDARSASEVPAVRLCHPLSVLPFRELVALLAGAALFVPQARAQGASNAPALIPASIVLPRTLVAGSRATLALLDADGRLVAGTSVGVSGVGEIKTDLSGRAVFTVPAEAASVTASLQNGGTPANAPVVAAKGPGASKGAATPKLDAAPSVIAEGEPFGVEGDGFNGDASEDRVLVGGQNVMVLAASPVFLIALANNTVPVGDAQLSVMVQGRSATPRPVTLVSLDLAGPSKALSVGQTADFEVRVAGSTRPLLVQVTNATPDVIDLPGGDTRRLVTSGGESNAASLQAVSLRPGDYSVTVRLLAVGQGATAKETARLELVDARGIADPKWQKKIDEILTLLKRRPGDVPRVQQEISKQLREHPPARIEDSLRVAEQLLAAG